MKYIYLVFPFYDFVLRNVKVFSSYKSALAYVNGKRNDYYYIIRRKKLR